MCDTMVALAAATAAGSTLFGKNSDRQRNEAQAVECFRGADHQRDAQLKCTYIAIPQARRTHGVLLCRPFWIWGAEMGANEHGVVIGNQGVRAKGAEPESPALTGMDLVRLALERGSSAAEAVDVITTLLERHGQGGNCGHLVPSYYHNAFMIADARDAFVLETVGREWLLERVHGVHAISNRYTIEHGACRVSAGLASRASGSRSVDDPTRSYAEVLTDASTEHLGQSFARRARSLALLDARRGFIEVSDVMRILRDHGRGNQHHSAWQADCTLARTLCMHAGADDRPGQSVGSMVSELHSCGAVHWVTATAAPCISIFKPVLLDVPLPVHGPTPTDRFDPRSLWWRHERLHRAALLGDFAGFVERIREERDAIEAGFRARITSVLACDSPTERARVVAQCWREAQEMENRWEVADIHPGPAVDIRYRQTWIAMSRMAGLPSAPDCAT